MRLSFAAFFLATTAVTEAICPPCDRVVLDFEGPGEGTYITDEFAEVGVLITARGTGAFTPGDAARIFDSSNPVGDSDLGSPNEDCPGGGPGVGAGGAPGKPGENCEALGNLLIVQEDDTETPDDNAAGGVINFAFPTPVDLDYIKILDLDDGKPVDFTMVDENESTFTASLEKNANNGLFTKNLKKAKIIDLEVDFPSSGAIAELAYWICPADFTCTGVSGDPHFRKWNQERYSFHGEGDFVFLSSKQFQGGAGLDVQVRTTITDFYSSITAAAVRIADSVLEINEETVESVLIDGKVVPDSDLPMTFADGGFTLEAPRKVGSAIVYRLAWESGSLELGKYKTFLSVDVAGGSVDYEDAVGMSGQFGTSKLLGRDGQVMEDTDLFGMEWQVRGDVDGLLFQESRAPQWPEKVVMPKSTARRMGLFDDVEKVSRAEELCANKSLHDFEFCVYDILATGDEGMAGAW